MKKITLLLLGIFIALQSFAQNPDPELFKTWDLYSIEIDFGGTLYVADIDPPIFPYLTINQDLSFEGYGACNSFSGNYEHNANENKVRPINYTDTTYNCETQFLNDFETVYFDFFSIEDDYGYVFYTDTSDNLRHMHYTNNPFGVILDFVARPLSMDEYEFLSIEIYPNPVTDQLFIKSNIDRIDKISVYSISGKRIMQHASIDEAIDVTGLATGMYFLEVMTSEGRSVEKFMKN